MFNVLVTHSLAHREGKSPFFFSRYNFIRMNERGNTHYCFHCGGKWGFTPGKNGVATNCEDDVFCLFKGNQSILVKDALEDKTLEPHIVDTPGYPRKKPEDRDYEEWLDYSAYFIYIPDFTKWCEQNGYRIFRYNPMKDHDPVTHADAVVGGAEKYDFAVDWLKAVISPEKFPYIVCLR